MHYNVIGITPLSAHAYSLPKGRLSPPLQEGAVALSPPILMPMQSTITPDSHFTEAPLFSSPYNINSLLMNSNYLWSHLIGITEQINPSYNQKSLSKVIFNKFCIMLYIHNQMPNIRY